MRREYDNPKVGLITLIDPRKEWAENFKKMKGIDLMEQTKVSISGIVAFLKRENVEVVDKGMVKEKIGAINHTEDLLNGGIDCLLIHVPGWSYASYGVSAARVAQEKNTPIIIWGTSALSGITALKGALDEVGLFYKLVIGNPEELDTLNKVLSFIKASYVFKSLKNITLGIFGGRSMGMFTTSIDIAQYNKIFGIDIEHIDELEIVRVAKHVSEEKIEKYLNKLLYYIF